MRRAGPAGGWGANSTQARMLTLSISQAPLPEALLLQPLVVLEAQLGVNLRNASGG